MFCNEPIKRVYQRQDWENEEGRWQDALLEEAFNFEYHATDVFLRMKVAPRERKGNVPDLTATFWYSLDGKKWTQMKNPMKSGKDADFIGRPGKWIGAKFGFYCNRLNKKNDSGWMQIDWVRITA